MLMVFDLDGTLIDSREHLRQSLESVSLALGLRLREPGILPGPKLNELLTRAFGVTEHSDMEQARRAFIMAHDQTIEAASKAYPGTREGLEDARRLGWTLAIATNKREKPAIAALRGSGLLEFFKEELVAGPDSEWVKKELGKKEKTSDIPNSKEEMLRALMKRCKTQAKDCALAGDSKGDEEGARLAGTRFVPAGWGYEVLANPCSTLREAITRAAR